MSEVPTLTNEERLQALQKAGALRTERANYRKEIKAGNLSLEDVLNDDSEIAQGIKVRSLLESMPSIGKIKANNIMIELNISDSRRVRGLGKNQKAALLSYFK